MTALAWEGFNNYSTRADVLARTGYLTWPTVSTFVTIASPGFDGTGKYLACEGIIGTAVMLDGAWSSNLLHSFTGHRLRMLPGSLFRIDMMDLTAGAIQLRLLMSAAGCSVTAQKGSGINAGDTLASSANNVFALETWFYLETELTVASSIKVRVNGVQVLSYSGADTQSTANAYVNGHNYFGESAVANMFQLDDFYICDDVVTPGPFPNNTNLGDVAVTGP